MSKPFSEFYEENKKVTKKLFQKNPVAMIKALRAIVHEKAGVKEANEIFEKEKKQKK